MKKLTLFLISICLCTTLHANALKDLSDLLTQTHAASASFTQTVIDDQGQVLQSSVGTMKLLKPGYFWWQTTTPNEQLIVVKSDQVYFYQADLQQLTIKPFDMNQTQTPATLLLSGNMQVLDEHYTVHKETERHSVTFTLLPKTDDQLLKSIVISFAGDKLTELDLADHLDHLTKVSFNEFSLNPVMESSQFEFTIPKDTDVINQ